MNSDRLAPHSGQRHSILGRVNFRLRKTGLLVVLLQMGALALAQAGDPIRFVRPKADEKAPLRVNYSAEKAQAKDHTEPGAGLAAGAGAGTARAAQPVTITRRGRDGMLRKGWTDTDAATTGSGADRNRLQLERERARWRMSQSSADDAGERSSLFSSPSTFGTPPAASPGRASGSADRSGGYGAIEGSGAMPRSLGDLGIRGLTAGDAQRPGGRAEPGSVSGSSFGGGLTPGMAQDLSRRGDPGLGSRPVDASPGVRGPGIGLDTPGSSPYRNDPAQPGYEPPGRPLRSAFDLPSRPR